MHLVPANAVLSNWRPNPFLDYSKKEVHQSNSKSERKIWCMCTQPYNNMFFIYGKAIFTFSNTYV